MAAAEAATEARRGAAEAAVVRRPEAQEGSRAAVATAGWAAVTVEVATSAMAVAAVAAAAAAVALKAVTWVAVATAVPRGAVAPEAAVKVVAVLATEATATAVVARATATVATKARREAAEAAVAHRPKAQVILQRLLHGMTRSRSPVRCTRLPSCQGTESGASSRCRRGCR